MAGTTLITGARGFVGAWLARALLERGREVISLDRPRADRPVSPLELIGIAGEVADLDADLLDRESLITAMEARGVVEVFHLAAEPIVGTVAAAPLRGFETNVRGTWTLLHACVAASVERVVVASSDKAYGSHDELPYSEDFALQPRYPYDVSKAATDMIARSYAITYGLPVAVTRLANVYGGGDFNFSRIVPDTARALVRGDRPVIRSDGTPERDYIYAPDAVDAYLAIAKSLDDPAMHGRAWNAGAGRPYSVNEIVSRLIAVSGRDAEPDIQGEGTPHGEIDRQFLDSSRIREELGWEPRWELDDGLRETWAWYERHLSGD
jgi:CDP-glucose 4,6-dehydratase